MMAKKCISSYVTHATRQLQASLAATLSPIPSDIPRARQTAHLPFRPRVHDVAEQTPQQVACINMVSRKVLVCGFRIFAERLLCAELARDAVMEEVDQVHMRLADRLCQLSRQGHGQTQASANLLALFERVGHGDVDFAAQRLPRV